MKKILSLILIIISTSIFAQKRYYNNAVNNCGSTASSDLIECIKGSTLLNYDFTTITGETISTDKIKKSMFIIVTATWSGPFWGAVPALNQIMEENKDKIKFIIIFSDDKEKVMKKAGKISEYAAIVPAREGDKVERGNVDISGFAHKLIDNPTGYIIDKNKQIIDVARGAFSPSKTIKWEEVTKLNLDMINEMIVPLLK